MKQGTQERMVATSRLSARGQVVIPVEIRKLLSLEEGDSVKYILTDDGEIKIAPLKRSSVLDLFGSLKPDQPDPRDFSEIRDEMRREREEKFRVKGTTFPHD
ncbi:AbrB/MazE/SpoVT family DNA-binding domain-containing protein [Brevibacillus centrosporus]|uniref:AbrB/MazE/SpoVT family DNA-binding domain-containing protein n=1 Tax=Brevibacillus centrosporus TaxID=54910 RepID=UPI00116C341D|nr:AbrB/MazE/SpoVT family DNA-binding domain-containing protein [Brevibacillus centrosporus]MEC2133341.1 AbrB/MazE/SpoVT family DNA-binding domain-containing protein [Brevibacillus centrosporus]GED33902.1 hypothetical protein BCE02nite_50430 [Brevibacillus centrosporus]